MQPSSQLARDRPISFLLQTSGRTVAGPFNLIIRPEVLKRTEPSRLNVQQTLGGAWADSFGPGISVITIQGHTGWRGGSAKDGEALFQDLRNNTYLAWHAERDAQIKANQDPNRVELVYSDTLNRISVVVAPLQFELQRSKTRPLLQQYQIVMLALRDANVPPAVPSNELLAVDLPKAQRQALVPQSITALQSSINKIKAISAKIQTTYKALAQPIVDLADKAAELLQVVHDQVDAIQDTITFPLLQVAGDVQFAANNLTLAVEDGLGGSQQARLNLRRAASTFREAACNLANLADNLGAYLDFSGLEGSSNCSSTSGGSPPSAYADVNVFPIILQKTEPFTPLTADAANAVKESNGDIVGLVPLDLSYKMNLARRIAAGVLPRS